MPMKDSDRILIDTSVWIEFFKKKEPYFGSVSRWIDQDKICCTGIVLAELMQGAKGEKELVTIKEFLYVFEFLSESKELWEKAGELSFNLTRKGFKPGLSDCYIAVASHGNNVGIMTLDSHFKFIKDLIEIKLIGL